MNDDTAVYTPIYSALVDVLLFARLIYGNGLPFINGR